MDAKRSGDYLEKNNVPQNTLHKQDLGIGCAPCTRAISEDEDTGRWWWSRVTKSADYIKK
jgi:phosphoadenosine phosphosulfate reductase